MEFMVSTGSPISLGPLSFCHFLGFWSTYRGTFHSHRIAHKILIPKLTLLSILREKLTKLQHKTSDKPDFDVKSGLSDILCCNLVNFSHRMESKVSFASVCAPELKKMIKTKWAQCFWTPCMMVTRRFSYIFAACTAQFG